MADTHEEQLLSELLRGIAREDAHLDAAHLESRVMASAFARTTEPSLGATRTSHWVIAAAAAVAVLTPALFWMNTEVVEQAAGPAVEATEVAIARKPTVVLPKQPVSAPPVRRAPHAAVAEAPIVDAPVADALIAESPSTQSPVTPSPDAFVPLMPMTAQELTGSFQIVRVQMPRASLGALRSPLEQPNELVEADVLLGEDGMARAIRVSASRSVYPWRSR